MSGGESDFRSTCALRLSASAATALAPRLLAMICQCLSASKFDSTYLNIVKKSLALVQKADVYLSQYVHVRPSTPFDKPLAIDAPVVCTPGMVIDVDMRLTIIALQRLTSKTVRAQQVRRLCRFPLAFLFPFG